MTETDSNKLPVLKRTLGRKRKEKAKKQQQAFKTAVKMLSIKLEGGDFPNAIPPVEEEAMAPPKKRGRKKRINPEDNSKVLKPNKLEKDESEFLENTLSLPKLDL